MQQVVTTSTGGRANRDFRLTLVLALLGIFGAIMVAFLLPMSYRMPITLGIVQGLSEFLPISSSAPVSYTHLTLPTT